MTISLNEIERVFRTPLKNLNEFSGKTEAGRLYESWMTLSQDNKTLIQKFSKIDCN
jgi:hypothetical protein